MAGKATDKEKMEATLEYRQQSEAAVERMHRLRAERLSNQPGKQKPDAER